MRDLTQTLNAEIHGQHNDITSEVYYEDNTDEKFQNQAAIKFS